MFSYNGYVTSDDLQRIEDQRESEDALDWRSPNYEESKYDRYGWPIEEDETERESATFKRICL